MGLQLHHMPVMVPEVVEALRVQAGGRYVDGTLGEGGHSAALLEASEPGGQVLGLDADHEAVLVASERLSRWRDSFASVNTNFRNLRTAAIERDFVPVHGVLFDLGVSSLQLDREERGFSFRRADRLDMRFSLDQRVTAGEIVNNYPENELADLIYRLGEEHASRRIARFIVQNRPLKTSLELADLIERATPRRGKRIHPATKTFQALRIAVNDELSALESALEQAVSVLGHSGRLAVISYHSLEDRVVKNFIRREATDCICPPETPECICKHLATLRTVTKSPLTPSEGEIRENARSRSAKLRVAERV